MKFYLVYAVFSDFISDFNRKLDVNNLVLDFIHYVVYFSTVRIYPFLLTRKLMYLFTIISLPLLYIYK